MKTTSIFLCFLVLFALSSTHALAASAQPNSKPWQTSWQEFCKTITDLYANNAKPEDFAFFDGQQISWSGGEILEVSMGGEFEDFMIYVDMPKCTVKRPDGSSADATSLLIAYPNEKSIRSALNQIGISNPEHFEPVKNVRVTARLQTTARTKAKYKSPVRWVSGEDATGAYKIIQIELAPGAEVLLH
jgi:hypothetical protein